MTNEKDGDTPSSDPEIQATEYGPVPPSAPQQDEMRQEADDGTETEESQTAKLERDIKTGEVALIVINGLLLVTTIVIAVIYSGQLKQMRKATEASRKAADAAVQAMHIDDRAWVDISTGPTELIIGKPLLVPITIANNGKTSAFNVRGRIVLNVLSANERP